MEIAQLIAFYGDILTIKIVRDKQSRKSKGFAFVEMVNEADVTEAIIGLDNSEFQGKVLSVKFATEPVAKPASNYSRPRNPGRPGNNDRKFNPDRSKRPRL